MTTIPRRSPKLPFGTKDAPPSVRDAIETLEDRPVCPQKTPASSSADGYDREFCADASYFYVRINGSWKRASLSSF